MDALLVIDLQKDFCSGGSLAVPAGDEVVPVINELMPRFDVVVMTQDWHPSGHLSFASSHPGRKPYDVVTLGDKEQVLWPDHCVQGSAGAMLHPNLAFSSAHYLIRKGCQRTVDSYSAFFDNDQSRPTGLCGLAKELGVDHFYVVGLATDFCVLWTVLDGLRLGFSMTVIEEGVQGIDINNSVSNAFAKMHQAGARLVSLASSMLVH